MLDFLPRSLADCIPTSKQRLQVSIETPSSRHQYQVHLCAFRSHIDWKDLIHRTAERKQKQGVRKRKSYEAEVGIGELVDSSKTHPRLSLGRVLNLSFELLLQGYS